MNIGQITELLEAQKLAIAVDTTEFDANGLRLERGLLAQLQQFGDCGTQFVVPDVVWNEVLGHLTSQTRAGQEKISASLRKNSDLWGIDGTTIADLEERVFRGLTIDEQVKNRVEEFVKSTGVQILKSDKYVGVASLTDRYFRGVAPFEKSGAKKSEFPDAISLLCLDAWATEQDLHVLVVSRDKGWAAFCGEIDRLIHITELANALGYFQLQTNSYAVCRAFTEALNAGALPEVIDKIQSDLEDQIWEIYFDADAPSNYTYEDELVGIVIKEFAFAPIGANDEVVVPIRYDREELVVAAEISLFVEAEILFSFSFRDPVDKDYIPWGSLTVSVEDEVVTECLLTFEGDFENEPAKFDLTNFELEPTRHTFELEEIEPDWMNEPPDD